MRQELKNGDFYTVEVVDIHNNYDHFPKPNPKKFCHRIIFEYSGFQYDSQICTESTTQDFCRPGDTVDIKISTFTRGQYTLESITLIHNSLGKKASIPVIPTFPPLPKQKESGNEPEIAMQIAAEFHSRRSQLPFIEEIPDIEKTVIPDAEKILAWIYEKKNQTKQS